MKAYIVTPLPIVSRGNAAYLYTVYNVLHFFSSILVELNFFIHSILYLRSTYKHSHDSLHLSSSLTVIFNFCVTQLHRSFNIDCNGIYNADDTKLCGTLRTIVRIMYR